ncbi:hypothetical protein NOF04DRAFT_6819 [Fusarium oxysporum II5]|nr:uncharacterized protein FOIG_09953 [Fusarium odoratissimum NRRL 54006]EXL97628.1 hypothetical protein FOIG_09953 [Fusarium odoratissimum NRRL 54006]KAK2122603.1 hypothetical protein NOF04DRAFT_6819 [Fusarium oxysporum II5]
MELSGIKGIAAVQSDGTLTSWAGESPGLPRWRLKGAQGVSVVKAEFDALKLVSLSRDKIPNQEDWLNNCPWYPEVPRDGLLFSGSTGDKPPPKYNLPVTTDFFDQSDDRYLSHLSEIVIWVFDICHVAGIKFRFTSPTLTTALYLSLLTARLVQTNLDRNIQTPDYPYGTDKGWSTVHGKGSQIIGMFASLSRPFWDLGLIR